jgi:hypothetical protein
MAELTPLQEKLGEVLGLAQAAQQATKRVASLGGDEKVLNRMRDEAAETERLVKETVKAIKIPAKDVNDQARETKKEAVEMMRTYLGRGSDALDGFEWLTMAEAGELGHWEVVQAMNKELKVREVNGLVRQVLPIQKRHVKDVRDQCLTLAVEEAKDEG